MAQSPRSRDGDFERLIGVLSPDVVLRADDLAVRTAAARQRQGAPALTPEVRGARLVAASRRAVPACSATVHEAEQVRRGCECDIRFGRGAAS